MLAPKASAITKLGDIHIPLLTNFAFSVCQLSVQRLNLFHNYSTSSLIRQATVLAGTVHSRLLRVPKLYSYLFIVMDTQVDAEGSSFPHLTLYLNLSFVSFNNPTNYG
jgi:hypothetical protein